MRSRGIRLAMAVMASSIASAWGSALLPSPVLAGDVMADIAKTRTLIGGTSKDAFPFAYQNQSGAIVGYSIDMMRLIKKQLEKELGIQITLKLVALESDQRIAKLESGEVNIICDASSFTWERDRKVDFSVSYGITGTQLLVGAGSTISDPESLVGMRVGALPKSTNELAIRKLQPKANLVLMNDRESGYRALAEGRIDAFADDGVLLYAWLQRENNDSQFEVVGAPYSKEGIACMLPENNSAFQRNVNLALIRYMQGFLLQKPEYQAIFKRWFGPDSDAPMTKDLRNLYIETMQLMVDFKQEVPEKDL